MLTLMDWIDANVSEYELIAGLLIVQLAWLSLTLWIDNRELRRDQAWRRRRG